MLISKELNDAINAQIGREFGASLQYINIATYLDAEALVNMAKFFYLQADEEHMHAMKFVEYIVDAGGKVSIPPVNAPQSTFTTVEEAVKLPLDWEMEVTHQINDLMDIAVEKKDYIAQQFLNWFTNEQLEEVSLMDQLLSVVKRAGEANLFLVDQMVLDLRAEAGSEAA